MISSTEAVVAGFEFKLEGADGSDLTGTKKASGTDAKEGTTVETYIAKGLVSKDNLDIVYVGNSIKETEENKAVINEYRSDDGYLKFTVYHFSKYAIISKTLVASDNLGNMYFASGDETTEDKKTSVDILKEALATAVGASTEGGDEATKKKDITITLLVDIDLKDVANWTPVGAGTRSGSGYTGSAFKGTFDGNGHTISNLKINSKTTNSEDSAVGLFGVIDGGTVKNLIMKNLTITNTGTGTSSTCVGSVVGLAVNDSTIENVAVESGTINATEAGGIVGRMTIEGTIKDCTNKATVASEAGGAGGIVGKAYYSEQNKEINIINCTNKGTISATNAGAGYVGGIAGLLSGNAVDCTNDGNVSGKGDGIGGIVGDMKRCGSVRNCTNTGDISDLSENGVASDSAVGGIVGWVRYDESDDSYKRTEVIEISGNTNSGNINGNKGTSAGGIVGIIHNAGVVEDNTNTCTSITSGTFASGIVGEYQKENSTKYNDGGEELTSIIGNESNASCTLSANCKADIIYTNDNSFVIANNTPNSQDNTVCYIGTGASKTYYKSLKDALKAVEENQTIMVMSGEYPIGSTEDAKITISTENVKIMGENDVIFTYDSLTGNGAFVVTEDADGVELNNLTFKATVNSNDLTCSVVEVNGDNCIVKDCKFLNNETKYTALTVAEKKKHTVSGCTFDGGFRQLQSWAIVNGGTLIENCTFKNSRAYNINFQNGDKDTANITIKGCKFSGWNSYAGVVPTFENCVFTKDKYGLINAYTSTTFKNCSFSKEFGVYVAKSKMNENKVTFTFTNCTTTNGTRITASNIKDCLTIDTEIDSDLGGAPWYGANTCQVNGSYVSTT